MKSRWLRTIALLSVLASVEAKAAVTLLDSDWKVTISGFLETDVIHDSTRSYTEIIGNAPVLKHGTFGGDNGRTVFSNRNSRFNLAVQAPEQEGWRSKGVLEIDFLGYDPNAGAGTGTGTVTPGNSESSMYSNSAPRLRLAYLQAENNESWQVLAGQSWSTFGWQPTYVPATVTVAPAPGVLFQRTAQVTGYKTWATSEHSTIKGLASLERPSQRDGNLPNMVLGAKYSLDTLRAGYASTYGDVRTEPMSVAASTVIKRFTTPNATTSTGVENNYNGSAFALDAMIPILPASNKDSPGNTLMLTAEFTTGSGYADALSNWTGGLSQLPNASVSAPLGSSTDLDAGQGGYDAAGNFSMIHLQTFNLALQYQLPGEKRTFITGGYSQLAASNIGDMTGSTTSAAGLYNKVDAYFINIYRDLSKYVRVALEYDRNQSHYYVDGTDPANNRYQAAIWFRF